MTASRMMSFTSLKVCAFFLFRSLVTQYSSAILLCADTMSLAISFFVELLTTHLSGLFLRDMKICFPALESATWNMYLSSYLVCSFFATMYLFPSLVALSSSHPRANAVSTTSFAFAKLQWQMPITFRYDHW